jgi:FG-GAP-like repeat
VEEPPLLCSISNIYKFALVVIVATRIVSAQVSFLQPPTYSGSGEVFVADFNGDGKLDLLTAGGELNLGNGDGSFKVGTQLPSQPSAVADFNGDGKPDVLIQGNGTLLIYLGKGDGTFQSAAISTPERRGFNGRRGGGFERRWQS